MTNLVFTKKKKQYINSYIEISGVVINEYIFSIYINHISSLLKDWIFNSLKWYYTNEKQIWLLKLYIIVTIKYNFITGWFWWGVVRGITQ